MEAKGETDNINKQEVQKLLQNDEMDQIYRKSSALISEGCLSFWLPESKLEDIEILDGDSLRITTKKNSPLIGLFIGEKTGLGLNTHKLYHIQSINELTMP